MKKGSFAKRFQAGKLFAAAVICLLMFSGLSDTLAINTYVRDLKGLAVPVQEVQVGAPLVALTFDVQNEGDRVGDLLLQLRQSGVKATFFLTADWVAQHPKTAYEIVQDGHEVGELLAVNQNADVWSEPAVQAEMNRADAAWKIAGLPAIRLFRAPDGVSTGPVAKTVRDHKEQLIAWSVNAVPAAVSMQGNAWPNLVSSLHAGDILRMSVKGTDVQSLPQLLQKVKDAGYRFGTITAMQKEVRPR